jgi:hypothetical protein
MGDSIVAVKVMDYDLRAAHRVQNELDCAGRLDHRNVASARVALTFGTGAAAAALEAAPWFTSALARPHAGAGSVSSQHAQQVLPDGSSPSAGADSQKTSSLLSSNPDAEAGQVASGAAQQPEEQQQYFAMHTTSRRNLADISSATGVHGSTPGMANLVTWLVMSFSDMGTLWTITAKHASSQLDAKLVGVGLQLWLCICNVVTAVWTPACCMAVTMIGLVQSTSTAQAQAYMHSQPAVLPSSPPDTLAAVLAAAAVQAAAGCDARHGLRAQPGHLPWRPEGSQRADHQ